MEYQYVRAAEAAEFLGIGKSTYWRWVQQGRLPAGIHLSARCTVWEKADLTAFVESMKLVTSDDDEDNDNTIALDI